MKLPYFVIGPAVDGRDRWCIGFGNVNWRCWTMPRRLSFGRYFSTTKL